jgi:PPM family protein phosphatase
MTPVQSVTLLGADHPDLGELAVEVLDGACAIGLSAGRLPKDYWHLDPNEDAVLAARGEDGVLLAVADGHNGADASHAAVAALQEWADALLGAPHRQAEDALARALVDVEGGLAAHLAGLEEPREASRTALTVALLRAGRLFAATYGDTSGYRVRGGKARALTGTSPFLGSHRVMPSHGSTRVRSGDRIVLCSDGVTDFLGTRAAEQVGRSAEDAPDARSLVDELLQLAWNGGAGDHLSAAVAVVP